MTVDELLQSLRERDAVLYVEDGRLKYTGPKRSPDDPIRAAIQEYRCELIAMFSAPQPAGWSDRLGREILEPAPGHPGQWREPEASAVLCIHCPEPLAEGDLLSCVQHQEQRGVTARPVRITVAVTQASAIGRHDLLALAELRGWEALPFKTGESAGGTEAMWRTFAETVRGEALRLVLVAVWERWRGTVEQYGQVASTAAPESPEAA